jgi:septum formation protein
VIAEPAATTTIAPATGAPAVVLASASPARLALLRNAGIAVTVDPGSVDEEEIKRAMRAAGAPVEEAAARLAELKALRVSGRRADALVIGADQILECNGVWFDKPADRAHAAAHLAALSGKAHRLVSAAAVVRNGAVIWRRAEAARMVMRPLTPAFIEAYLDALGDDALRSVGAYQLEGLGAQLFERVEGDFFTVLGLPLLTLLGFLREHGVVRA